VNQNKDRTGFSLIEVLIVMVIIAMLSAMLLPALRKGRAKAAIDKTKAEMQGIATTMSMARLDTGYYVRLCDLAEAETANVKIYFNITTEEDDTGFEENFPDNIPWDGPYQTYQATGVYNSTTGPGTPPITDIGVTGWPSPIAISDGTPLDAWGHPYLLAYNAGSKVMIIYSAGPDGKLQTGAGATIAGDKNNDGTVDYENSDDLIYNFR
jgi:prepilin-type N-terminal cleavage/methylation domain-containing protein